MTVAQSDEEYSYRLQEREGILAQGNAPTKEETAIARAEALAWLKEHQNEIED